MRAYAEVSLGELSIEATRATKNSYDNWTIAAFGPGDKVGMYAMTGREDPDNPNVFNLPVTNMEMYYEGRTGNYYRFGNSEIVLDPTTVKSQYSIMYRPYFADMPVTTEKDNGEPGIPLRETDPNDNIEKCQDFMHTSSNYITVTDGIMRPSFVHECTMIVLQRGQGFDDAKDKRIWVVMHDPATDMRITQSILTSGQIYYYDYTYQYLTSESEEELMIDILPGVSTFKVNKYRVWQAWDGNDYNSIPSKYVIVPPKEISFIFIQDNYGNWHNVTDFYLSGTGSKSGSSGYRYTLTIDLKGVDVVARPVVVEKWDDEVVITDNRKVGINNYDEYNRWVSTYNAYIENNRSDAYIEELRKYGDGINNTATNYTSWTFYINSDITFPNNEFYKLNRLDDILEGSSTYTNYTISNIRDTMVGELGASGAIRALDFKDIYLIQPSDATEPFGAIAGTLNGGLIEDCNIFNGILIGNREVGMIAGTALSGVVKGSAISGDVIGDSTAEGYHGFFGKVEGNPTLSNIITSGLKFIHN